MRARAIVVEDPYTDADFSILYCLLRSMLFCVRSTVQAAPFFQAGLMDQSFSEFVRTPQQDEALQRDYLGFVVVRPLPQTIIGRCVLKTYDDDGGARRRFPVIRRYNVSLFGLDLYVDGLGRPGSKIRCWPHALQSHSGRPFTERAIYLGRPFQTPAVITQAATQAVNSVHYGRPIPQHGLRVEEMCAAIRQNGLEPEAINLQRTPNVPVVSLLYGYMRMGLPQPF